MNTNYNPLVELLESIVHLLRRLEICTQIPPTPALDEMLVRITAELLSTLALVTKEFKQGRSRESAPVGVLLTQSNAVRFAKKHLGGKDVEAVIQRLDCLTQDEAQIAAGEILKVVYGLVQNINVVINGKQMRLDSPTICPALFSRRKPICRRCSGSPRCVLWKRACSGSEYGLEILHEIASDKNKSKRQSPHNDVIAYMKY